MGVQFILIFTLHLSQLSFDRLPQNKQLCGPKISPFCDIIILNIVFETI